VSRANVLANEGHADSNGIQQILVISQDPNFVRLEIHFQFIERYHNRLGKPDFAGISVIAYLLADCSGIILIDRNTSFLGNMLHFRDCQRQSEVLPDLRKCISFQNEIVRLFLIYQATDNFLNVPENDGFGALPDGLDSVIDKLGSFESGEPHVLGAGVDCQ